MLVVGSVSVGSVTVGRVNVSSVSVSSVSVGSVSISSERIVTACYGFRTREVNTLPVCTRYYHRDSYQT